MKTPNQLQMMFVFNEDDSPMLITEAGKKSAEVDVQKMNKRKPWYQKGILFGNCGFCCEVSRNCPIPLIPN